MTNERSVRSARICAGVSAALLTAVLIVGGIRSAAEEPADRRASAGRAGAQDSGGVAVFAADRNAVRADEMDQLKEIVSDPSSSDAIRSSAQARMMRLMEWMELEATIADVLTARGFELPVVTVHEDSVNVVLRADRLTQAEAGIILELVTRETGVTGGNVKIIPIN